MHYLLINKILKYNFLGNGIVCYSNPTNSFVLECANGDFAKPWSGCIDQGSVRVRCPRNTYPCNDLVGNGIEFSCWKDCSTHGGPKMCENDGNSGS